MTEAEVFKSFKADGPVFVTVAVTGSKKAFRLNQLRKAQLCYMSVHRLRKIKAFLTPKGINYGRSKGYL